MKIRTIFSFKAFYCAMLAVLSLLTTMPPAVASDVISDVSPLSHLIIPCDMMLKGNGEFVQPAASTSGTLANRRFNALNLPRFEKKIPGDQQPKVIPGRFIIKFADSLAEPADIIHEEQHFFASATPANGDDLDRLHNKNMR